MRYRTLTSSGDMTFGHGQANFLVNTADTVGQLVMTRLRLLTGEWFLDTTEGTPYAPQVLGKGTAALYDHAIKQRILGTQGVTGIAKYASTLDPDTRKLTVSATIDTIYGQTTVNQVL